MKRFDATVYVQPESIRICGVEARDEDEARERALDIALKRYARVAWMLDEVKVEEVGK